MTKRKYSLLFRVLILLIACAAIFITAFHGYSWIAYNNLVWWQYIQLFTAPFAICIFGYTGIIGIEPSWVSKKRKKD
jgi:hypothetical protein